MDKLDLTLKSAHNHGEAHADTDPYEGAGHQIADLEEALRIAWSHLSPEDRRRTFSLFDSHVGLWED